MRRTQRILSIAVGALVVGAPFAACFGGGGADGDGRVTPETGAGTTGASAPGVKAPALPKQEFIEIILDLSGSMNEAAESTTKLAIAKARLSSYLVDIGQSKSVGLRVYAGQPLPPAQSCKDSRLLVPIGDDGAARVPDAVAPLRASGNTPIAFSLLEAAKDFSPDPGRINTILLISDGEETCEGDPAAVVNDLQAKGYNMQVKIIGFFVDSIGDAFLSKLAKDVDGEYTLVKSAAEFDKALCAAVCGPTPPGPTAQVQASTATPTGTPRPATAAPTTQRSSPQPPTATPTPRPDPAPPTATPTSPQPPTFTPTRTQPPTFTPTRTQPPTFTPTRTPLPASVGITIDRGHGATYDIGDAIQVCYTVSRPMQVQVIDYRTSGGSQVILSGYDDGNGGCISGSVQGPPGQETLTILGEGGSQASVTFYVAAPGRTVTVTVLTNNSCPINADCYFTAKVQLTFAGGSPVQVKETFDGSAATQFTFLDVPAGAYQVTVHTNDISPCADRMESANSVTVDCRVY